MGERKKVKDVFQDIWVYINKQGQLFEVPALITKASHPKWTYMLPAIDRDNYTFIQEVAVEPGMIFNNAVWFRKQNYKKAKTIFLTDYQEKVNTLTEDLQNAQDEYSRLYDQKEAK